MLYFGLLSSLWYNLHMKKISDLGLTGRKLVGEGLILVIIGICFLIAGWQFPGLILRFIYAGLFFLALYELRRSQMKVF